MVFEPNSPPVEGWQAQPDGVVSSGSTKGCMSFDLKEALLEGKTTPPFGHPSDGGELVGRSR